MATKPKPTTTPATPATTTPKVQAPVPATPAVPYVACVGTRKAPASTYRKVRQALGYGRVAAAQALGVHPNEVWANENVQAAPCTQAALAALAALPPVGAYGATPQAAAKARATAQALVAARKAGQH